MKSIMNFKYMKNQLGTRQEDIRYDYWNFSALQIQFLKDDRGLKRISPTCQHQKKIFHDEKNIYTQYKWIIAPL